MPPDGTDAGPLTQGPPAAADMAAVYQSICLDGFPSEAGLASALRAYDASPLTGGETMQILHADPGRGWRFRTAFANYTLTVEDPPFNTCALRRMTRMGLPTALPYVQAVKTYAARTSLAVGQMQQLNQHAPQGFDIQILGLPLLAAGDTTPHETSIYVTTNYHGRFDPARAQEAIGGVGVEVRMAHQILGRTTQ